MVTSRAAVKAERLSRAEKFLANPWGRIGKAESVFAARSYAEIACGNGGERYAVEIGGASDLETF